MHDCWYKELTGRHKHCTHGQRDYAVTVSVQNVPAGVLNIPAGVQNVPAGIHIKTIRKDMVSMGVCTECTGR